MTRLGYQIPNSTCPGAEAAGCDQVFVVDRFSQAAMATGIDGLTINLPGIGHKNDGIGLVADIAKKVQ